MPEIIGIITWLVTVVLITVLLKWRANRIHKKDEVSYDVSLENAERKNIETADPMMDVVVIFEYLQLSTQSMMKTMPRIIINHTDTYKLQNKTISLKLPPSFELHFGIPYMGKEAFKFDETMKLDAGYVYKISFQPKTFIFSKPIVITKKLGEIKR